uniref:CLP1_P domain-containing protein n=1 Tax=Parastrongyloides trichosuri TaxID=131310 RepID=A0A0N4ZQM0_PARTI
MFAYKIYQFSNRCEAIIKVSQRQESHKQEFILMGGHCGLAVLHGEASVQGYTITKENSSHSKLLFVGSFPHSNNQIVVVNCRSKKNDETLDKNILYDAFPKRKDIIDCVARDFKYGDLILFLAKKESPSVLLCNRAFSKEIFNTKPYQGDKVFDDLYILDKDRYKMDNFYKCANVISELEGMKTSIKCGIMENFIIVTTGGSKAGKSSLNRYITNNFLSMPNVKVYWADFDIEHPEFTPSGVLSLTHVKEPLLTPAHMHFKGYVECGFLYGKNNLEFEDQRYYSIISEINRAYGKITLQDQSSIHVLIINTLSITSEIGKQLMERIFNTYKVSICFSCPTSKVSKYIPKSFNKDRFITVTNNSYDIQNSTHINIHRKTLERMFFTSYFGLIFDGENNSIFSWDPSFWPYHKVPFSKVKMFIDENLNDLERDHFADALNVTLVALCVETDNNCGGFVENDVNKSGTLKSLKYVYRGKTGSIKFNRTNLKLVGFGIITNIDEVLGNFHICTPLTKKELSTVNVIARERHFVIPAEMIELQDKDKATYGVLHTSDSEWLYWNKSLVRGFDNSNKNDYRYINDNNLMNKKPRRYF